VLLHLLAELQLNLRAVHIHHGLSPNADSWAAFCEQVCKRLKIPFILQKVTVDRSEGIEAGARTARYQAIGEIIQPNEVLVTAHHLDDQAETFLLALKRGSGIKGLSAMQAVGFWQNFTIFRPLLNVSRAQIEQYA
ncbi:tRNA lysidine(34) synthetase TilS, partial [Escherichia coli]|uniref:tRNA lysidine(34) synthetase TilS n=2 Tax=Gammaproteobacteria TaxID=1236 RepID=UPI00132A5F78